MNQVDIPILEHQAWGPAATAEILESYKLAGLVVFDDEPGTYRLNVVTLIDLLDTAWLKYPQEDMEEGWECVDRGICDGQDHWPIGYRGPEIGIGVNGPATPNEEANPLAERFE